MIVNRKSDNLARSNMFSSKKLHRIDYLAIIEWGWVLCENIMQIEEYFRLITSSEICIILRIIWKPNSVIVNIIHLKYL